jgi:diguanylate cyclase (GGDEF)-like protein
MMNLESTPATQVDWTDARLKTRRLVRLSGLVGVLLAGVVGVPAAILASVTTTGDVRYFATGGWLALLCCPIALELGRRSLKAQLDSDNLVATLTNHLSDAVRIAHEEADERDLQARRQKFESRLANALDMAEGEPEVIDVIERSFHATVPDTPIEFLLADNSHAHVLRVASASPTGSPPGCVVDSPDHCPAARRAQVQRCSDSDELDACLKLRDRPQGAVSAACVPVSIMGRTVGVLHATGERRVAFPEDSVNDLETLAKLAGARIGLLRVMAETQLQAATDNLTGLLNRRSFEEQAAALRRKESQVSVAMADLDHFKVLNDTYGHETGDRALRLFSRVLTESVRNQDLVCRHGGEEFVIALPGCNAEGVRQILTSFNVRLDAAITVASLPRFTTSIGIVEAEFQEDLRGAIGRADAALFEAKHLGRSQIVVHDAHGRAVAPPKGPASVANFFDGSTAASRQSRAGMDFGKPTTPVHPSDV